MVPANVASLVFFSPPYPTALVKYDRYNYDGDYRRWQRKLYRIIKRSARTLRCGGRVIINVDATSDTMKNATTKYDVEYDVKTLAKRAGLTFADDIVWFKQTTCGSDGHVAWGTYCSPHKPNVRRAHEYVLVFYKDSPFLEVDGIEGLSEEQVKEKRKSACDILPDEFRHATISAWNYDAKLKQSSDHIGGDANQANASSFWYIRAQQRDGSHPAPFSEPLAEMVIKTYSYRGDLVIDPYSGSGTTCAVAQRNGRRWVGIDMSPDYCAVAQERLRKQNDELRPAVGAGVEVKTQARLGKPNASDTPDEDAGGEAGGCVAA
jgi:site-specific DNA-methyltransferase (adenine-specific)